MSLQTAAPTDPSPATAAAPLAGARPAVVARLREAWLLGDVPVANRVLLAPLAGIGNWFVRLQARRYGAGLAVSEMVSSFGLHYGNPRTCNEMLRIHPDEHPVSVQLFGPDPEVMRSAAARVAEAGADLIDINMGCPVPKVVKTGAGAALIDDPDRAVAVARAAREGSGLPVTVKLRSGTRGGERTGVELARRLVADAGVAGIGFHPRPASAHHRGAPDYALAAALVASLPAPVLLTGGLRSAAAAHRAFEQTGAAAVLLARGTLGYPWLFAEVLGDDPRPSPGAIRAELDWVIDRAEEHLGPARAARYLRKFYPWYLARLGASHALQDAMVRSQTLTQARGLLGGLAVVAAA
ncbi:MAG: dihydrouridine synthase [Actinobacteria bacterium]|nr:MAG: dihydrouridine synthase [Actinomycetota bacterium]